MLARGPWSRLLSLVMVLVSAHAAALRAAGPAQARREKSSAGSSSREAREEALRAIPYQELDREARIKVGAVLANTTIFRHLPATTIECDPTLFVFLLEHPDLVVNMWEALGVSEVELRRTGEQTFDASDKAGTRGQLEYLYLGPQTHLLYADGTYTGSLMSRPIRGRCVLLMRSTYARTNNGRPVVRCSIDAFLHLENVGVGMLAKTFQPLVTTAADHNFRETAAFLGSVHQAAVMNYAGMQRLTEKLSKVDEAERQEFSDLTTQVAVRAALAQAGARPQATAAARPSATARPATAVRPMQRFRQR